VSFAIIASLSALTLVCGYGLFRVERRLEARRRDETLRGMLDLFAPAVGRIREDPRQLLVWQPLASVSRHLFPDAFEALDRAHGDTFPFTNEQIQAAHARWTAEWLAWERTHDLDYKLRASEAERDLEAHAQVDTSIARARLAAIEREALERYQERYEEYVKVAKALSALDPTAQGPTERA